MPRYGSCGDCGGPIFRGEQCLNCNFSWYYELPITYRTRPLKANEIVPQVPVRIMKEAGSHDRFVGYELECYVNDTVADVEERKKWKALVDTWNLSIVSDGSLHAIGNRKIGIEVRLPPTKGAAWYQMLSSVLEYLRRHGLLFNERTGGHCHIDLRDATPWTLTALAGIYAIVEPFLFSLHPNRVGNSFCRPAGKALLAGLLKPLSNSTVQKACKNNPRLLRQIYLFAMTGHTRHRGNSSAHNSVLLPRYSAINFQALNHHKTIEFRMGDGIGNLEPIYRWGRLLAGIVKLAGKKNVFELAELAQGRLSINTRYDVLKECYLDSTDKYYLEEVQGIRCLEDVSAYGLPETHLPRLDLEIDRARVSPGLPGSPRSPIQQALSRSYAPTTM